MNLAALCIGIVMVVTGGTMKEDNVPPATITDLAVVGSLGAGLPVTRRVKLSLAIEVPFAFLQSRTIGLVGLTGVSILL